MNSTNEFLNRVLISSKRSSQGWNLSNEQKYDDEYDSLKFKKSLEILDANEIIERFEANDIEEYIQNGGKGSFDEMIQKLADSLKDDIKDCTKGKYDYILEKTAIGLIPLSLVHAFCTNVNEFNEPLDGNLICINQGLYFCLSLLAKAIVMENLSGELTEYRNSGEHTYKCATKLFLKPNKDDLNEIFFDDLPPEIYGEISAYQSKVSMMILQFVALHEFGHIVNKDLELMGLYKFHMAKVFGDEKISEQKELDKFWSAEYRADTFALAALCDRSKQSISAWGNFITIYLFFHWLNAIEKNTGRILCPYHPTPLNRANELKKYMYQRYGLQSEAEPMLEFIETKTISWMNGMNDYLNK